MMQSRGQSHSTATQEAHHTHLDILVVKPESAVWHSQGPINGPECVFPTRRKSAFLIQGNSISTLNKVQFFLDTSSIGFCPIWWHLCFSICFMFSFFLPFCLVNSFFQGVLQCNMTHKILKTYVQFKSHNNIQGAPWRSPGGDILPQAWVTTRFVHCL